MKKNVKLIVTISSIVLLLCACRGGRGRGSESSIPLPWVSSSTTVTPTTGDTTQGGSSGTTATSQASSTTGTTQSGSSSGTSSTSPSSSSSSSSSITPTSVTPSTSSSAPAHYYDQCEGLSGSDLANKLYSINTPKSPSYDWSRYEDADEALDDSTSILCVYTRHNIKKSSHCGTYAWDKWNREHVWTQSLYPASDKDNHNIFACEGQINNYRGNLIFDEGGTVVTVFGHVTECKLISNVSFEPCDAAKGEIARSVMYGTVQYKYTMTNEIKSIALALKWHLQHPITERDIRRNEVVYGNQGNRNPFVDHPEYACRIWGNTNSETRSLCGM